MTGIETNVQSKIDTNKDALINATELSQNINKLKDTEYKDLAVELKNQTEKILVLILPSLIDVVTKNNLLDKTTLTINDLKIIKLFFMIDENQIRTKATKTNTMALEKLNAA
jgi:hypothetical protein